MVKGLSSPLGKTCLLRLEVCIAWSISTCLSCTLDKCLSLPHLENDALHGVPYLHKNMFLSLMQTFGGNKPKKVSIVLGQDNMNDITP